MAIAFVLVCAAIVVALLRAAWLGYRGPQG